MKRETISLRRRQLMIAGLASGATPALAGALWPQRADAAIAPSPREGEALLLSGRVASADGIALPHATVELMRGGARATTDADGRFMVSVTAGRLDCRIAGAGRAWRSERIAATHAHRDEAGMWRATVGLTVA